jgi:CubicO group peptidase (beta-lactamase class C family)
VRRIDPAYLSLGRFFHEEIATPLGLEFDIGLPEAIPDDRLAPLEPPSLLKRLTGIPPVDTGDRVQRQSAWRHRAGPRGSLGAARAIAKAYGVFASGGRGLGLRPETIEALSAPAIPPRHGLFDECFRGPAKFSLGIMKLSDTFPVGRPDAFGAPGGGGAMGYTDPHRARPPLTVRHVRRPSEESLCGGPTIRLTVVALAPDAYARNGTSGRRFDLRRDRITA